MREIADLRVHGTTGEAPLVRFQREEAAALKAVDGRPPFRQVRDLVRRVQADCAIEVDATSASPTRRTSTASPVSRDRWRRPRRQSRRCCGRLPNMNAWPAEAGHERGSRNAAERL